MRFVATNIPGSNGHREPDFPSSRNCPGNDGDGCPDHHIGFGRNAGEVEREDIGRFPGDEDRLLPPFECLIVLLLCLSPLGEPGPDGLITEYRNDLGNCCIAREREPVNRFNRMVDCLPCKTECLGQGKGPDRAMECPGDPGRVEGNKKPRRPLLAGYLEASGSFRDTVLVKDRIDRHGLFLLPLVPGTA